MKEFAYKIQDEVGIHARPAGILVKKAGEFQSEIKLIKGDKEADLKKIFAVMGLGVKKGETVRVQVSGSDEDRATAELERFFRDNL